MTYVIDTDCVVDFLVGQEAALALFRTIRPQGIAISLITFMEVYEGIVSSRDPRHAEHAFRAAHIRAGLRRQRHPITHRALDILIAATALVHDLTLVTRNRRDYEDIADLKRYEPL